MMQYKSFMLICPVIFALLSKNMPKCPKTLRFKVEKKIYDTYIKERQGFF